MLELDRKKEFTFEKSIKFMASSSGRFHKVEG